MKKFTPVVIIGDIEDEEQTYQGATLVAGEKDFSPTSIVGYMIALYSAFETCVDEKIQTEFEKQVGELFKKAWNEKYERTDKYNVNEFEKQ